MKRLMIGWAAAVLALAVNFPLFAEVLYRVTWLGDLPGGEFSSRANALNDHGQVVGRSATSGGYRAFFWEDGTLTRLPEYSGGNGQTIAFDINNRGQVVGYSSGEQAHSPFLWSLQGGMVNFGSLPVPASYPPGYPWNGFHFPYGINEGGQIAGRAGGIHGASFEFVYSFLYDSSDATWIDLGGLPYTKGSVAYAKDINDHIQVVGYSTTDATGEIVRRAFLWETGEMTDLGALPGGNGYSSARSINNNGQIVGDSDGSGMGGRVTVWDHGTITQLPNLPGDNFGDAFSNNDRGQVVGRSIFSDIVNDQRIFEQSAVLWEDGTVYNLNECAFLSPDTELWSAADINNRGQITGHGIGPSGFAEAFLLSPVSNPHPGDANLDIQTDLSDFNIWNANKFSGDTGWTTADFNGDGTTDLSDFNIWNAHKFTTATGGAAPAPVEVPEPGAIALLLGAAAFALIARKRRPG